MISLTGQQVKYLHAINCVRDISYRYELLNNKDIKITDIEVTNGRITFDSDSKIKRFATFNVRGVKLTDLLNKRVRPYLCLKTKDEVFEWPLGIFIPSTGTRTVAISDQVKIDCYDASIVITEDNLSSRYLISTGASYINEIQNILSSSGIWKIKIPFTPALVGMDKEFEIGTSKIDIVNSLLAEINYTPIWVDENGYFCSGPYVIPTLRPVEYEYITNDKSIILTDSREEETDLFNTPNKWIVTASNPEKIALSASYTNNNPTSKTSTVSRGRTITYVEKINDIADQDTLNSYVERLAYEQSSKVYTTVRFSTPNMPHHTYSDCIWFEDSDMGIANKFVETAWDMTLGIGGRMTHTIRRVIDI